MSQNNKEKIKHLILDAKSVELNDDFKYEVIIPNKKQIYE